MTEPKKLNFIEEIVKHDVETGKHEGRVHTRFPPEPNGFLHIGHAKAICLNFDIAEEYNGLTNLRFDDTNPSTEETKYVEAIKKDLRWLGYDWGDREYYTSDYFPFLHRYAVALIEDGKAYVDESTPEEIAEQKGNTETPGTNSPYRDRPMQENLRLFTEMTNGVHEDGAMVLRAKIDMSSPNMHMRDPVMYRIKKEKHHRTGEDWNIYPMYDFAHGQSDSIERITHSLCSLEFENHRPLYNWFIEELEIFPSRQIEFSRLNLSYTIMSKRKLLRLVKEGYVSGWDDPRMPTLAAFRRKGYPPEAIRNFIRKVGMTKRSNVIDLSLLEFCARERLNEIATRRMVVEEPLKLIITNFEAEELMLSGENNPESADAGSRDIPFSRELWIEREDFMIDPPKKYFRLAPDAIVRLKHAFIIQCEGYEVDPATGAVQTVYAKYFPETRSGQDNSGIKAKGTLHWVSAPHAIEMEIRNYDRLFMDEAPDAHDGKDFVEFINPDSLHISPIAQAEPAIADLQEGEHLQLLRKGYYYKDIDSTTDFLVLNKTVGLRDNWAKKKT